jgi:type I restriction enzyme S subunit
MTPTASGGWVEVLSEEYCDSVRDGTHDSPKFLDSGFPLITSKNIKMGQVILDSSNLISESDFREINRRSKVDQWDVLFSMIGTVGEVCLVQDEEPTFAIKNIGLFKSGDELRGRWLYYWLSNPVTKAAIKQAHRGASQQYIPLGELRKLPIRVPDNQHQMRQVVGVLSAYDDLIENNRRRMALLEESARLLYREWFVRLRFPGHEHTHITDGVPDGWERNTLAELTCFLKRGITPAYDDEAEGLVINQKCIRDGQVNLGLARHQSKEVKPERLLQLGDVLVNSTGEGTLGRVAQVKTLLPNCTIDTHVTIVRPKEGVARHYFGLAVMEWEPRFSTMGKGATNQTELSPATIGNAAIVMPSHTLLEQFELFAEPLYEQVTNFVVQNEKLRTARDLLLPRLMSGEIAV